MEAYPLKTLPELFGSIDFKYMLYKNIIAAAAISTIIDRPTSFPDSLAKLFFRM